MTQADPDHDEGDGRTFLSRRVMEFGVALIFVILGVVLAIDNYNAGIGWTSSGPASGTYPFILSLIMIAAGIAAIIRSGTVASAEVFSTVSEARRLGLILIPSTLFVAAIGWLGIYVSGFVLIAGFLRFVGRFSWLMSVGVALGFTLAMFWVFRIQFQVFLPSGPIEAWLGY